MVFYNEKEKLWVSAATPPLYNPNVSLGQVILQALKLNGRRTAQINADTGITLRYDEILSRSTRIAQNLRARGYEKGQIFGYMAKNSHNVAPILFASWFLGCPINAMDVSFGVKETVHMMSITQPRVIFCDASFYEKVRESVNELGLEAEIITIGGQCGDSEPLENLMVENGDESNFIPNNVDGETDIAIITCSSGTTGFSKAVCHSHALLIDRMTRFPAFNADDVIMCFSLVYWITGLRALVRGTLVGATRLITTDTATPELQLQMIQQYRVTCISNSVNQSVALYNSGLLETADLSTVQSYITGGNRVSREVAVYINDHLPNGSVHIFYGISEVSGSVTIDYPTFHANDSTGTFVSGAQVKIVDDNGNRCGVDESGEICLKLSYKPLGYYKNAAANDELFDSEGFMLTGDIGRIDENGFLFIMDRKKDLLKCGDIMICPSFIEGHLIRSPSIEAVCLVGVPDDIYGQLFAAAVVPNAGAMLTESMVRKMVDDLSVNCELRGGVHFMDAIPTTSTGKVLRRKVVESIAATLSKTNLRQRKTSRA